MAFDDLKEFDGRTYSGMPVGGTHTWHYTDAIWRERKLAPDRWEFSLKSVKRRAHHAPPGSGAPPNTLYHWYVVADQRVRKVDEDSYTTFIDGLKYKVAHKRPHWRRWNSEYPGQLSERERVVEILEETLLRMRAESSGLEAIVPSTR